jgi:hypothetical protein
MIYQLFPRSCATTPALQAVIDAFNLVDDSICSSEHNLHSNAVLAYLAPHLIKAGYIVEKGKSKEEKIPVPVLFGVNNSIDKEFNADAYNEGEKTVIEIEAGQAIDNNKYLKAIFEACMMHNVDWLVLAVRQEYRGRHNFRTIYTSLEILYLSNRLHLPLKGILLIGY